MTDETQNQDSAQEAQSTEQASPAPAEQQIIVGFKQAMIEFNPDWERTLSVSDVNIMRSFYLRGVRDMSVFSNIACAQLVEVSAGINAGLQTVINSFQAGSMHLIANDVETLQAQAKMPEQAPKQEQSSAAPEEQYSDTVADEDAK